MTVEIKVGDCRTVLKEIPDSRVHCCVTSPPYFGLRDYGHPDQIGHENTPDAFIVEIVSVMREVRRVLRDDGTLWLNLGDSRAGRSLMGIPWRVALALIADQWILRQDVIWHKTRPLPDGAKDRPSVAHEYMFMFSVSNRYHYDAAAVMEPTSENSHGGRKPNAGSKGRMAGHHDNASLGMIRESGLRNRRSVWSIAGTPYPGAHCAPFPTELVEPCIKAGCPEGGTVLDPFGGSGTTGLVASRLGRNAILIELSHASAAIAEHRLNCDAGMFAEVSPSTPSTRKET